MISQELESSERERKLQNTVTVQHSEVLDRINNMNTKSSIRAIMAYAIKNLKNSLRYPGSWFYWMFLPLLWLIPYAFQGQALIDGKQSEFFLKYGGTGDYFSYIAIGIIFVNIIDAAIWGSGNNLRWEQHSGTFEYLWISPVSRIELMLGASLSELSWIVFVCTCQFFVLNWILAWSFTFLQLIMALIVMLVSLIGLFGFSFMFASIILVFKEPGTFSEVVDAGLNILLPIRYPTQILPNYLKWITMIIPFSYGFFAIRFFTIATDIVQGLINLAILFALSVLMWVVGLKLFKRTEKKIRKTGQLGAY